MTVGAKLGIVPWLAAGLLLVGLLSIATGAGLIGIAARGTAATEPAKRGRRPSRPRRVVALVAVVATGRYPRAIFDFNAGVLRWTWRVAFYSYGALGTDRYPPFTLGEADYPARIEIPYPEQLSRGAALVKWWLLALPHYLVLAVLAGGFSSGWLEDVQAPSLHTVLVVIAAVALLFTGRYPADLFRLLVGINRWVFRVIAYAALMRDEYPPFRLDP